jgi:hypothetical protein
MGAKSLRHILQIVGLNVNTSFRKQVGTSLVTQRTVREASPIMGPTCGMGISMDTPPPGSGYARRLAGASECPNGARHTSPG